MRRIAIIGATGSIARSTFRVVDKHSDLLEIVGLGACSNAEKLLKYVERYNVKTACLYNKEAAKEWSHAFDALGCRLLSGPQGLKEFACLSTADVVVAASPGTLALEALLCALEKNKSVALANKESLVLGGHLLTEAARKSGAQIIPLDSEHNAIFQCIQGVDLNEVRKVILTASGGPFLYTPLPELKDVTPAQALAHPTWDMGAKVSLDCATMANKGLELIEAFWLFGLEAHKVDAWMHPQSLVHGLVETQDGALMAQMGVNDMSLPIQYALLYPRRQPSPSEGISLASLRELNFFAPDEERYPCFFLAKESLKEGGISPCVFNSANTIAGKAFMEAKISFLKIPSIIDKALQEFNTGSLCSLDEMLALEQAVFCFCKDLIVKA